jgi:hypothetical protein
MIKQHKSRAAWARVSLVTTAGLCLGVSIATPALSGPTAQRAAVPGHSINHVLVIDLENESYAATFGPGSPATYLNSTLLQQGQLVTNYFATSHVSLGNYLSQVSGQAPTTSINDDCINLGSLAHPPLVGSFTDVAPGTDATDQSLYPGQVVGDGCVFPAPTSTSHGVQTIGDQLDALPGDQGNGAYRLRWRSYAEDMGNDPARDYGDPDTLGGTACAHAPVGGVDNSNSAEAADQYATRHNPFVYFHSVIDDQARCDAHVVPLGTVTAGQEGGPDVFAGHLYEDLQSPSTTPDFMFVTPNLCNDGHDATCAGYNVEGGHQGGLVAADLWLKHWMPMILASPVYQSGQLLVVLTFDEAGVTDARACPAADQSTCGSPTGPNVSNPGYSTLLGLFHVQKPPTAPFVYPGGGQVGAVLFNRKWIVAGSVNTTGYYNHYSALRSYEDILGVTSGGDDGLGHLGYASTPGLQPFGADVFGGR